MRLFAMAALCALALCALALCALALTGCGSKPTTVDEMQTRPVTLPNGAVIRAEVVFRTEDMLRGLMFRDSLAPDHGMLFVHTQAGQYGYWMYQVRIPLDIIWLDRNKTIVEMSENTPPCPAKSSRECPTYGGRQPSMFVLELGGGMAAKHGLRVGQKIDF